MKEEPVVVTETLKTLKMLLEVVIQSHETPTRRYMDYFIAKLNALIPLASKEASKKLKKAVKMLEKAKEKIEEQNIHPDFYVRARATYELMKEV